MANSVRGMLIQQGVLFRVRLKTEPGGTMGESHLHVGDPVPRKPPAFDWSSLTYPPGRGLFETGRRNIDRTTAVQPATCGTIDYLCQGRKKERKKEKKKKKRK